MDMKEAESEIDLLKRRLWLIAKLAGLEECARCAGSGEGEHQVYGGALERCRCYFCDGAGFIKQEGG